MYAEFILKKLSDDVISLNDCWERGLTGPLLSPHRFLVTHFLVAVFYVVYL